VQRRWVVAVAEPYAVSDRDTDGGADHNTDGGADRNLVSRCDADTHAGTERDADGDGDASGRGQPKRALVLEQHAARRKCLGSRVRGIVLRVDDDVFRHCDDQPIERHLVHGHAGGCRNLLVRFLRRSRT
jgi:hypothetical protein